MMSTTAVRRALLAGAASLTAAVVFAGPAWAARPLTVTPLTATSNEIHGDSVTASGDSCDPPITGQITIYLYQGAFGEEDTPTGEPIVANSAVADEAGAWSGALTIPGGAGSALPAGQYTVRAGCYPVGADTIDGVDFWYANVVITINGTATTTTVAPATTTTAAAAANNAVNAAPAFTG